jgi:hypothetical protein
MSREPMPDPFTDGPEWTSSPPRPIVPTPAILGAELRGQRVIIGLPGLGWRADLRADDRVVQGSRTYVPVMPESEWYRAEAEQTEVFAPLVPVERVWVEETGLTQTRTGATDVLSKLVSLDDPPRRDPLTALDAGTLTGRRVVHMDGPHERRALRAVTELHTSDDGDICARVTAELDWYRWAWTGRAPHTLEIPVHQLWVE